MPIVAVICCIILTTHHGNSRLEPTPHIYTANTVSARLTTGPDPPFTTCLCKVFMRNSPKKGQRKPPRGLPCPRLSREMTPQKNRVKPEVGFDMKALEAFLPPRHSITTHAISITWTFPSRLLPSCFHPKPSRAAYRDDLSWYEVPHLSQKRQASIVMSKH
ncbi:hypothetical protein CEXT_69101 [Caerostris extrusa]|uniref:Secreted protein n=1 Tax=Caerostris extrusa TaxID=172846 RepID=A0AAV4TT35_CAEEX|nr:hypothetical protein CEXT_69101 [Caerostris extrusa]